MSKVINIVLEDYGIDFSKYMKKKPTTINGMSFDSKSLLVTDDDVYNIDLMPLCIDDVKDDFFQDQTAYLNDNLYYLYRGQADSKHVETLKPGIYLDKNPKAKQKYFIIQPVTDKEKKEYDATEKVSTIKTKSLIDSANNNPDMLIAIPESTKIFQPDITENDDILKVITKKALAEKNVDLDRYKHRFSNKNELFNFKQVLRSDNTLSMKIFTRGMEALNLVFKIIIFEKSANNVVGERLKEPIETSSEETYQMSA